MPEQEELLLKVTFDGAQASAGLRDLQDQMKSLGTGAQAAGTERLKRSAKESQESFAGLGKELTSIAGRLGFVGGFFGKIGAEFAATGLQALNAATNFKEVADSTIHLNNAAHAAGTSAAQMKENIAHLKESGFSYEEAENKLITLADRRADLMYRGSAVRKRLMEQAQGDPKQMEQWIEKYKAASPVEAIEMARKKSQEIYETQTRLKGAAEGAQSQRMFERDIGFEGLHRARGQFRQVSAEEEEAEAKRLAGSEQFQSALEKQYETLKKITEAIAQSGIQILNNTTLFQGTNTELDTILKTAELFETKLRETKSVAEALKAVLGDLWVTPEKALERIQQHAKEQEEKGRGLHGGAVQDTTKFLNERVEAFKKRWGIEPSAEELDKMKVEAGTQPAPPKPPPGPKPAWWDITGGFFSTPAPGQGGAPEQPAPPAAPAPAPAPAVPAPAPATPAPASPAPAPVPAPAPPPRDLRPHSIREQERLERERQERERQQLAPTVPLPPVNVPPQRERQQSAPQTPTVPLPPVNVPPQRERQQSAPQTPVLTPPAPPSPPLREHDERAANIDPSRFRQFPSSKRVEDIRPPGGGSYHPSNVPTYNPEEIKAAEKQANKTPAGRAFWKEPLPPQMLPPESPFNALIGGAEKYLESMKSKMKVFPDRREPTAQQFVGPLQVQRGGLAPGLGADGGRVEPPKPPPVPEPPKPLVIQQEAPKPPPVPEPPKPRREEPEQFSQRRETWNNKAIPEMSAQLDQAAAQNINVSGSASISVDVNAPPGTTVGTETKGQLFKRTEITRQTQMLPADWGPSPASGVTAGMGALSNGTGA